MNTALKVFTTKARLNQKFEEDVSVYSTEEQMFRVDFRDKILIADTELVYYITMDEVEKLAKLDLDRVVYEEVMDVAEDFELLLLERMNV